MVLYYVAFHVGIIITISVFWPGFIGTTITVQFAGGQHIK